MAIAINHAFTNPKADGADTTIVKPSDWNAALVWSGLGTNQLLYSTGATALAQSSSLTFDGTTLTTTAIDSTSVTGSTIGGAGFVGTNALYFFDSNAHAVARTYSSAYLAIDSNVLGIYVGSAGGIAWSANATLGSFDRVSGISQISSGLLAIGTGTAGSFAGSLKLTSAIAAGVAVASLNASPTTGEIQSVTDALVPVVGNAVANGGAAKALVWWNGAQWTVVAV